MPAVRNDGFTCFVHGHGAKYSSNSSNSDSAAASVTTVRAKIVPPLAAALESAKTRAAAQLALQRAAIRQAEKK